MAGTPARPPVLIVGNFLSHSTGTRGVCEDLAERLARRGWRVLTTSDRPGRTARLCNMVATCWRRRADYRVAQVDVFSGPAFLWAEAVCWTLRHARKPYILTLHGGNLPALAARHPARVKRLLLSAAAVTTPSRYLLEQMKPHRQDLRLLPNALDLGMYTFRERAHPQPSLVWLRAFHAIYNPALAVKALALLLPRFPGVRLTMVGPDKGDGSMQEVRSVAEGLGVLDRLTLPGKVSKGEVGEWMNKGDVFLNTTNVDNTPVSVLEAMACGLCVVSTNVGGVPYLLEHERDALLVPPNDPEAMAVAVERVLTEPDLAERLSGNARAKAEQYDWTAVLPRWEELLMEAGRSVRPETLVSTVGDMR